MGKRALITGITGQDGSYLAEFLLEKGYEVHGLVRRNSRDQLGRIAHLAHAAQTQNIPLTLHHGDIASASSLHAIVQRVRPDEVYNLAAQSHVAVSFALPETTLETIAMGNLRLLEALSMADWQPRFYQAGTSEMFGKAELAPQDELTPFNPRSPYAIAKVCAHAMTIHFREARNLFAVNGIMFNHESPRRSPTFISRKVTHGIAQILAGEADSIALGNLEARRDWGYAREYVAAMWLMLQQEVPQDFVIATGQAHSVRDLVQAAFALVDLDWRDYVTIDPQYLRATEVDLLVGDASRAETKLGWRARTTFSELLQLMLAADLRAFGIDPNDYPGLQGAPTEPDFVTGSSLPANR